MSLGKHKQLCYKQLALDGKFLSDFQDSTLFHWAAMKTTA